MRKISNELLVNAVLEYSDKMREATNRVCHKIDNKEITVDLSELKKLLERSEKEIACHVKKIQEKEDRFSLYWKFMCYSLLFCLMGLASLFFAFKFGFQSKQEYLKEVEKENFVISRTDYPKLQPFFQSEFINSVYNAYLQGDISDKALSTPFEGKQKKQNQPKDKNLSEMVWDELGRLFK